MFQVTPRYLENDSDYKHFILAFKHFSKITCRKYLFCLGKNIKNEKQIPTIHTNVFKWLSKTHIFVFGQSDHVVRHQHTQFIRDTLMWTATNKTINRIVIKFRK